MGTRPLDRGAGWALVAAKVVANDHIAVCQGRHENLLDIKGESRVFDRTAKTQGAVIRSALSATMKVSDRQWPCGLLNCMRYPRARQPRNGAMFVFTRFCPMKTSRCGSFRTRNGEVGRMNRMIKDATGEMLSVRRSRPPQTTP